MQPYQRFVLHRIASMFFAGGNTLSAAFLLVATSSYYFTCSNINNHTELSHFTMLWLKLKQGRIACTCVNMPPNKRNIMSLSSAVPIRYDINQAVQPQRMVKGLIFRI